VSMGDHGWGGFFTRVLRKVRFCFFEHTVFTGDSRSYVKEDTGSGHLCQWDNLERGLWEQPTCSETALYMRQPNYCSTL